MRGWVRRNDSMAPLAIAIAYALSASQALAFLHNNPDLERGKVLYDEYCASCHGVNLEGQPDWRSTNADGAYPAPPHDASGHTWHHGDSMLQDYIKRGGQAVLDDMDVSFVSGMPAFGNSLSDEDIRAVLDYIKSTWPAHIRAQQEERTANEAPAP